MSKILQLISLWILLVMTACSSQSPPPTEKSDLYTPASDEAGLFLNPQQLKYAGIEYGTIHKTRLSSDVNARGELVLPVNSKADLVSLFSGIVSFSMTGCRLFSQRKRLLKLQWTAANHA